MHITARVQLTTVVAVSASFSLKHCLMLKYVKNREMFKYIFMHANNTPIYDRSKPKLVITDKFSLLRTGCL
jgi:hypothetical protein